ncbi:MAG TPA: MarR family transcriptional regulator [Hyphomicrobiaceae bacterium]|jgi:DNA-binding MarR family transcriptional regulator|nr:MarR family transcriptional regulator [Hyphomicrobiaceae bacterium]
MSRTQDQSQLSSALHLLHRAGQRADELFTARMGEKDLTPRQYAVLKAVASMENPSQTALVEYTGIDRSTIADIVRRLIKRGMLQRRRTAHDARMYAVKLTPSGREALEAAEPIAKATEEQLLSVLPAQQRSIVVQALSTIVDKLKIEANGSKGAEGAAASATGRRRRSSARQ